MMCVVHDLAEAQVGDITPRKGSVEQRNSGSRRKQCITSYMKCCINSPAAQRIEALWEGIRRRENAGSAIRQRCVEPWIYVIFSYSFLRSRPF
ncbi:uncharacterized protein EV420DRAFT_1128337 [Desarmillaria tabescens]|uniref:HD domain-containing protein n=1 Tax=Armillaria tabescens TaxID=1929756 RepID=A0AA39MN68_ARMTA|nr:uncharacterized protein EV420DRAFT_1128337 [Desarmillaria tabescens]KAK0440971.1 hypothetical protein EV420DRAFT_1128337 [Desarmillaria tabescens]